MPNTLLFAISTRLNSIMIEIFTFPEPTLQFEKTAYSIAEPESTIDFAEVTVRVQRTGERNRTAMVRCSTRDGSALSGLDYDANSKLLIFKPGSTWFNS